MEAGRHFDVLNPELSISPLAPLAATDAAMMAQAAQLFILSHEFGYVLFYRPPDEDDDLSTRPVLMRAQEFATDATGMRNLIRTVVSGGEARMRFPGVMISLRVLAVLASLCHTFSQRSPTTDRQASRSYSFRTKLLQNGTGLLVSFPYRLCL
jgi:hypothetical protein